MTERDPRTQTFWDLGGFDTGHGLEIGPLSRTVADRPAADVQYVDVYDTEGVREAYAHDPGVDVDLIPDIDFPLIVDGTTRGLVEATAPGAPFDWVMASHVIEHVPDVIGWLQEVGEVVVDDGCLVLAVPDKRYCFDVHRPTTTVGAMIEAHDAGDTRPSVRAVYDHFSEAVTVDTVALWKGARPGFDSRIHAPGEALTHVERRRGGEYVDCHVWTFTPDLFLRQLHELRRIGLSPWYVEVMHPTSRFDLEFRVKLHRVPRADDASAETIEGEQLSELARPDWAEADVDARTRIRRLKRQVKAQERELAALRESASWRVGQAVVSPLGAVRRRLRRTQ